MTRCFRTGLDRRGARRGGTETHRANSLAYAVAVPLRRSKKR